MRSFRTGAINAAGGKPLDPEKKTYRCVVATTLISSITTAGDHGVFSVGNYNTPVRLTSTTTFATPAGISTARHPTGHVHLIGDGYNTFLVKKSHYRIYCWWNGVDRPNENWIFGYKFDHNGQSADPAFVNDVTTVETWLDLQATRGWVWKRFSCSQDNRSLPCSGIVNINIPDYVKLAIRMHANDTAQFTIDDLQGVIADSSATPALFVSLHIVAFKIAGGAGIAVATPVIGDIHLDIRNTLTVSVWKAQDADEIMDEGDDV